MFKRKLDSRTCHVALKMNTRKGNMIENHLKYMFHKQAHHVWKKNKVEVEKNKSALEFPALESQCSTDNLSNRLHSINIIKYFSIGSRRSIIS